MDRRLDLFYKEAMVQAAAVLQCRLSWPQAEACARDLADAGLLIPDDLMENQ